MATRRLTIYLLNESTSDFDECLAQGKSATVIDLSPDSGLDGRFHHAVSTPKTPGWVPYLQPVLLGDIAGTRSLSASGLLLLRVRDRVFALTFGYGRALLDLSRIEYQFGLRVALNCIDASQLRSLDTKTFEDLVVTTTTQVSRSAELPTFGVDVSTDILRGVTGEPKDAALAKRLSGSDALVLNVETAVTDLGALCQRLLDAFGDSAYKENFEWIDQLAQVRRSDLIEALDEAMLTELREGTTSATHLALPESIDWEDIDVFKIAGTRAHEYDDLDLDAYLAELGEGRSDLTSDVLRSRRVSVRFSRNDSFDDRWSLYRCLVSEQRVSDQQYVLIEGRWFAVSDTLVEQVDHFLATIPASPLTFPVAEIGEVEKAYNERLAASVGQAALNLDARIKRPGGAASGIEVCDVFTRDGEFVHVKRKSRSATLSHLFAQGSVSGTAFLTDGHFRDEIRDEIRSMVAEVEQEEWLQLVPGAADEVDRTRVYGVTYAVVTASKGQGTDWLPFFSKLNLMQNTRQLRSLGFRVSIARIPVRAGDAVSG